MFMYKLHAKETQKCMRHAMIPKYNSHSYLKLYTDMLWARPCWNWNGETRGQGYSDLETGSDSPGPNIYLRTKYGSAIINNIGDLLCVHFFTT